MKALAFPFRLAPSGKLQLTTSYDEVVRGQMIDVLMTNLGERVFRPRFGCDVQSALFDPADELVRRDAASFVRIRLEQLVTRAMIRSVTIEETNQPSVVIVRVVYRSTLYATDTEVAVPVASEFIARQEQNVISGGVSV